MKKRAKRNRWVALVLGICLFAGMMDSLTVRGEDLSDRIVPEGETSVETEVAGGSEVWEEQEVPEDPVMPEEGDDISGEESAPQQDQ